MEQENLQKGLTNPGISRRSFLKRSSLLALSAGIVGSIGCADEPEGRSGVPSDESAVYDENVPPAPTSLNRGILRFFTPHEADTVEALTARIIPGTPEDPGAREADVTTYLDLWLSVNEGYWQPTYREPPYPRTYTGEPPDTQSTGDTSQLRIWVAEDELERYGYQSVVTPRESFRLGLHVLDGHCQREYGRDFVELSEEDQDAVVGALSQGNIDGFNEPSAADFFDMVRSETINGMFGDPAYGGNRDKVGWLLLDYPGAQRGYTPEEMRTEANNRQPQSLAELHPMNPGQPLGPNSFSPLQNAEQHRH